MVTPGCGDLLRRWRDLREVSQLALAADAGVSARHLSFIESGRSKPSREMLLNLADALDVPLRERNALLNAVGFAPVYRQSAIDSAELADVLGSLEAVLERLNPYPCVVMDHLWVVLRANAAALRSPTGRRLRPASRSNSTAKSWPGTTRPMRCWARSSRSPESPRSGARPTSARACPRWCRWCCRRGAAALAVHHHCHPWDSLPSHLRRRPRSRSYGRTASTCSMPASTSTRRSRSRRFWPGILWRGCAPRSAARWIRPGRRSPRSSHGSTKAGSRASSPHEARSEPPRDLPLRERRVRPRPARTAQGAASAFDVACPVRASWAAKILGSGVGRSQTFPRQT
jgi:transcriptional regulator with XRE-family HTH domain